MTEEVKKEEIKTPEKKIYAEARGKYSLVDCNKVFVFDFPINSTIEDNFSAISFIKEQIMITIEDKAKADLAAAEKAKEEPVAEEEANKE